MGEEIGESEGAGAVLAIKLLVLGAGVGFVSFVLGFDHNTEDFRVFDSTVLVETPVLDAMLDTELEDDGLDEVDASTLLTKPLDEGEDKLGEPLGRTEDEVANTTLLTRLLDEAGNELLAIRVRPDEVEKETVSEIADDCAVKVIAEVFEEEEMGMGSANAGMVTASSQASTAMERSRWVCMIRAI